MKQEVRTGQEWLAVGGQEWLEWTAGRVDGQKWQARMARLVDRQRRCMDDFSLFNLEMGAKKGLQ